MGTKCNQNVLMRERQRKIIDRRGHGNVTAEAECSEGITNQGRRPAEHSSWKMQK